MSDATVLFDYNAEANDELTLKEGELIKNIDKKEDGWWEGELRGKRGMFPENFVKEVKRSVPESRQEKSVEKATASSEKTAIAKVTFDYEAENEDELSLKEGEIVEVLSQEEEGWWKGSLNGKVGVFPANFVELEKGVVSVPKPQPVPPPIAAANEEHVVKKETPVQRAKALGGVGFGGILTQDALSGIKLRKNKSGTQINPIQKPEQTAEQSELRKKLSIKRNPPRPPDQDKHILLRKAIVEFDYEKEQSDELTLCTGDVVNILESDVNEGWSRGELNGKTGLFPDNFVKLLPPEQPKKKADISKEMDAPKSEDMVDTKPSRPELPAPKLKKPVSERPPAPLPDDTGRPELPVSLRPTPNSETSLFESKPATEEKPPIRNAKPIPKKSPPILPKKPDKPKLPGDGKDQPSSPPPLASKKTPPVILRHQNGLDNNPTRRFSTGPISEVNPKAEMKRHSQGSELHLNLNDIKSTGILQPLTSDRPKNTAKSPPTKYGRPHSPKKVHPTDAHKNDFNETELFKESRETQKPAEKPKKPALPESSKPKTESMVDSSVVKKLQDQINILKESVESIAKQFSEHVEKSEKRLKKTEKKLIDDIEDITKELDEEKKARSAIEVEVKRLTKLIKNQQAS